MTTTRYLGICPVCTREQKLTTDNRMVHHGFQRPGDGMIHGDCFGVGYLAYQLSCEGTQAYLVLVNRDLLSNVERLNKLTTGQVKVLSKEVVEGYGSNRTVKLVEVKEGDGPEFGRLLKSRIAQVESTIVHITREVERLQKLITDWKLTDVRTVEEGEREAQAEKDTRKAAKDAIRAAAAAKKAATKAKQDALKAKRQAIMDDFKAQFVALAAGEITDEVKAKAQVLARETGLKKYSWFSPYELGIHAELVKLGLATSEMMNGHEYKSYSRLFDTRY